MFLTISGFLCSLVSSHFRILDVYVLNFESIGMCTSDDTQANMLLWGCVTNLKNAFSNEFAVVNLFGLMRVYFLFSSAEDCKKEEYRGTFSNVTLTCKIIKPTLILR